jgi:DNA-binding LacI/PurR family transcriptional regulator
LNRCVDGLIVAVSKETKDLNHFTPFEKLGIPVVFYGRNPSLDSSCHKVLGITFKGSYDATEFLINKEIADKAYQKVTVECKLVVHNQK